MFSHVTVGANDIDASRRFYDATFAALGLAAGQAHDGKVFYLTPAGMFMITKPLDGKPASPANGGTIGFAAASPEHAAAWHAAGVAAGGTTCEDPPGVRDTPGGGTYLAYLRDPAGNKLCALHSLKA